MGMKKKAMELSKLCAIPVLLICCAGDHVGTWPENDADIRHIIDQFRTICPEDRERRKLDLMGYIKQQTKKMSSEHDRLRRANFAEHQLFRQGVLPEGAKPWEIVRVLDAKLAEVNDRISLLKAKECTRVGLEEGGSHWQEDHSQLQYLLDNQVSVDLDSIMAEGSAVNCANALVPFNDHHHHLLPHQYHHLLVPKPSWTTTTTTATATATTTTTIPNIDNNNIARQPMLGGLAGYDFPANYDIPARLICDGGFDTGGFNIPAAAVKDNGSTSASYCGNCSIGCGHGRNNDDLAAAVVGGQYVRMQPWRPQTSSAGCIQFSRPENYNFPGAWLQNPPQW